MKVALVRVSVLRTALAALAAAWLALVPAQAQQQQQQAPAQLSAPAQPIRFPAFTGYVVDDAGILSPQAKAWLTQTLGAFQQARHQQVVVATIKDLQGIPIEDYGYQLGRAWGVGEKGKDTGAILLVAPKDRAVRIEVGYGLEGELTDAVSRQIIEQNILPAFRAGDYDRGVIAGVRGILAALGYQPSGAGASAPVPAKSTGQIPPFVFFIFVILLFAFLRAQSRMGSTAGPWRRSSRGVYPVIFPGGFGGGGGGFGGGGFGGGGGGSFGGGGATGRW